MILTVLIQSIILLILIFLFFKLIISFWSISPVELQVWLVFVFQPDTFSLLSFNNSTLLMHSGLFLTVHRPTNYFMFLTIVQSVLIKEKFGFLLLESLITQRLKSDDLSLTLFNLLFWLDFNIESFIITALLNALSNCEPLKFWELFKSAHSFTLTQYSIR